MTPSFFFKEPLTIEQVIKRYLKTRQTFASSRDIVKAVKADRIRRGIEVKSSLAGTVRKQLTRMQRANAIFKPESNKYAPLRRIPEYQIKDDIEDDELEYYPSKPKPKQYRKVSVYVRTFYSRTTKKHQRGDLNIEASCHGVVSSMLSREKLYDVIDKKLWSELHAYLFDIGVAVQKSAMEWELVEGIMNREEVEKYSDTWEWECTFQDKWKGAGVFTVREDEY